MKIGDMIWQSRMPGGICVLIEIWHDWEEYKKQLNERLPEAGDPIWGADDFSGPAYSPPDRGSD